VIDKSEFMKLMLETGNMYSIDVSKGQMRAYYDLLKQYPRDALQKAFRSHAMNSEWFPKISQIIALIDGTGKEQGADAWAKVMLEIRKTGSYGQPRVSPEIGEAISKIGGWKVLCSMTYRDLEFKAKDFTNIYQSPISGGYTLGQKHYVLVNQQNKSSCISPSEEK